MSLIPCFDSIKAGSVLEDFRKKFEDAAEGLSAHEQKELGRKMALDLHKSLDKEYADFKKSHGLNVSKYKEPGSSVQSKERIKEINDKYDSLISKTQEDAKNIRSDQGRSGEQGNAPEGSENKSGEDIQLPPGQEAVPPGSEQQAGQADSGNEEPVNVSHDALTEAANRLGLELPERGAPFSGEEALTVGRQLINSGVDPEEVGRQYMADKKVNQFVVAVARVHTGDLRRAVDAAKPGPERDAAKTKLENWNRDVMKPIGTTSGQSLAGLQDVLDIGSPTALQQRLEDMSFDTITIEQEGKIEEIAKKGKAATDRVKAASDKLSDHLDSHAQYNRAPGFIEQKDVESRFAGKKGNDFSAKDAADIWDYAKENYMSKGLSFPDMVKKVSDDLGLTQRQVNEAIITPKGAKEISDEMYLAMRDQRKIRQEAERWIKKEATPSYIRTLGKIPSAFFTLKTFGHGTVGPITHAGMNIFTPATWKTYWPNMIKSYTFAYGNQANYERAMEEFKRQPNYATWLRAGLAIEPSEKYDDYQFAKLPEWFKRWGSAGDRGFNALKLMRYDLAEYYLNAYSDGERYTDKKSLEHIADIVNHSTGTVRLKFGEGAGTALSTVFFAPKLEASRWARFAVEPVEAGLTAFQWGLSTASGGKIKPPKPHDILATKIFLGRAAQQVISYTVGLAINQGLLYATGSKQSINYTDPTKSDFLQFKLLGQNLDVSGGMLSTIHFFSKMASEYELEYRKQKGPPKLTEKEMATTAERYARGKVSPFGSYIADWLFHRDYEGRPYPWETDLKPPKGKDPIGWGEWGSEQLLPIPGSETVRYFHDKLVEGGMKSSDAARIIGGIMVFVTSATTGARVAADVNAPAEEEPQTAGKSMFGEEQKK